MKGFWGDFFVGLLLWILYSNIEKIYLMRIMRILCIK
jgi:hypothetical protein